MIEFTNHNTAYHICQQQLQSRACDYQEAQQALCAICMYESIAIQQVDRKLAQMRHILGRPNELVSGVYLSGVHLKSMQVCETTSQIKGACGLRGVQSIFGLQLAQHLRAVLQHSLCVCRKQMADLVPGFLFTRC